MSYEIRCTEASAMKLKEKDDSRPPGRSSFQAALGMPLVVDENIPENYIEVYDNGVLVKRYPLE